MQNLLYTLIRDESGFIPEETDGKIQNWSFFPVWMIGSLRFIGSHSSFSGTAWGLVSFPL